MAQNLLVILSEEIVQILKIMESQNEEAFQTYVSNNCIFSLHFPHSIHFK